MVALGAYAGRQERPYRRQDDTPLDDLPDVYIPNELSANEIEKAFSLAGKKQAVIEANEVSNCPIYPNIDVLNHLIFEGITLVFPDASILVVED